MKTNLHSNKPSAFLQKQGFTLIELLIVIAIIGILAAILVSVINPEKQKDKAKDAVIKSTMSKIGLVINSFNSAYGSFPTCAQLKDEFNSGTIGDITLTDPKCTIAGGAGTANEEGKYDSENGDLSFPVVGTVDTGDFWYWTPTSGEIKLDTTEAWTN